MTGLPALLLMAVSLVGGGDGPRAVITGPESGVAGDLVTLECKDSENMVAHKWVIRSPKNAPKKLWDEDVSTGRLRLGTPAGIHWIVELIVINDGTGIDETTYELTIPDPCPNPGPGPGPTPNPPQPLPPGPGPTPPVPPAPPEPVLPAGIATDVYKWALAVPSPARQVECKALADAAHALAAKARSFPEGSLEFLRRAGELVSDMRESFHDITELNQAAWLPFLTNLGVRLNALYKVEKKINSLADLANVLDGIETGLRAASTR